MLKEQAAELIDKRCEDNPQGLPYTQRWVLRDQILNLFKAEVDKLTMISREQNLHLDKWEGVEAQFNHTKKQLLDLMEE